MPSWTPPAPKIPTHNDVQLDRALLTAVLHDLSARILQRFGRPLRLVVHGGAFMVLHPYLKSHRRDTRDVDFIARAFVQEWQGVFPDARARLRACTDATAVQFGLGRDWMNADPDQALPMAVDRHGRMYDPIYTAAVKPHNVGLYTVFRAPGLVLVGVTPAWAIALKLVRYAKDDPADICALLRHGTRLNGTQWSPAVLEGWLLAECWAMYAHWTPALVEQTRKKIMHASTAVYTAPQYSHQPAGSSIVSY